MILPVKTADEMEAWVRKYKKVGEGEEQDLGELKELVEE